MLHDIQLQIAHGELPREADFRHLRRRRQYRRQGGGDSKNAKNGFVQHCFLHFVLRYRCMPQSFTVRASIARKITASTSRPITITARSPAKTRAVSSSERAAKMYQPSPPDRDDAPNTSSAAINVRQATAHPIFNPARMDGNAAGIRISTT